MVLSAGDLNRRIQIQRATKTPDGMGGATLTWADHGTPISARRRDVSDAERTIGGAWSGNLVSRFVIRATTFAKGIRRTDRLIHEGVAFGIDGIKELPPGKAFIEITANTGAIQ